MTVVPMRDRKVPPSTVSAALVLIAASDILLEPTLAKSDQPTIAVIWGALVLAAFSVGLLCLAGADHDTGQGFVSRKMGLWILLWYGIVFGIATLSWRGPQTGLAAHVAVPSVLKVLWLVGAEITAFLCGWYIGSSKSARNVALRGIRALP